jgi:hypothetical protein
MLTHEYTELPTVYKNQNEIFIMAAHGPDPWYNHQVHCTGADSYQERIKELADRIIHAIQDKGKTDADKTRLFRELQHWPQISIADNVNEFFVGSKLKVLTPFI